MSWLECTKKEFGSLCQFLIKNEVISINITSRLKKNNELIFPAPDSYSLFIFQKNQNDKNLTIHAAVLISPHGNCYLTAIYPLKIKDFKDIFQLAQAASKQIKSIISVPSTPKEIAAILSKELKTNYIKDEWIYYDLMKLTSKEFIKLDLERLSSPFSQQIEFYYNPKDKMKAIYQLHSQYLQEEVSTQLRPITQSQANQFAKILLKEKSLISVAYKGQFIAKANTNMIGIHTTQLGGIYTLPKFRSLGIASLMLKQLCQHLFRDTDTISLFVKKKNKAAIRVYEKCGFQCCDTLSLVNFDD